MKVERKAVNLRKAADVLGVHPHTLKRLIDEGRIRCVRVGRRYVVPLAELDRFLELDTRSA